MSTPLTWFQERYLYLDLAGSTFRHWPFKDMLVGLTLNGPLNVAALESSLGLMLCRHPALRSHFSISSDIDEVEKKSRLQAFSTTGLFTRGMFAQSVVSDVITPFDFISLDNLAEESQSETLQECVAREVTDPFEFETAPLLRVRVLQLLPAKHIVIARVSRLVSDRRSVNILINEWMTLYRSLVDHVANPLPQIATHFHDFSTWQWHTEIEGGFRDAVRYWMQRWKFFETAQITYREIGYRDSGQRLKSYTAHSVDIDMTDEDSRRVWSFCQDTGTSLFVLALTGLSIMLCRRTGKSHFPIWTTFDNRVFPGTEGTIGCFENVHFIPIEFSADADRDQILDSVRRSVSEAEMYQGVAPAMIFRALGYMPRLSAARVSLHLSSSSRWGTEGNGSLRLETIELPVVSSSPIPLGFTFVETGRGLKLTARHAPERISGGRVRLILQEWRSAIVSILA